jgi:hypothetical protein
MKTKEITLKKADAGSAKHIKDVPTNSNFQKQKVTQTLPISNAGIAFRFATLGPEALEYFLKELHIKDDGSRFLCHKEYVASLTEVIKRLNFNSAVFSKIRNVSYLELLRSQLKDVLKYSEDKKKVYDGLLIAFDKYIEMVVWVRNSLDSGISTPHLVPAPVTPKLPTQTYAIAA